MTSRIISGHILKIYDSIDDMPIVNFQKYNRYLLIDSGVGSTLEDIDNHITRILKFIQTDKNLAIQELQNMRQAMYFINQEISPKLMAFATLIYEIDGVKITDYSDDNLKSILAILNRVERSWLDKIFDKLKKKINSELDTYFPLFFDNTKEKEVYDKLKQRTIILLDGIISGEKKVEDLNSIDNYLLNLSKPKQYSGESSIEVLFGKQFEKTCILIAQKTGLKAKEMTVFEFYTTLEQVKKQIELEIKSAKKKTK